MSENADNNETHKPTDSYRKYILNLPNYKKYGYSRKKVKEILQKFKGLVYACMCEEIGGEHNTPHMHIYFRTKSPVRWRTVKQRFPSFWIKDASGSDLENKAYLEKSGKWAKTDKALTSVPGTFEEIGVPQAEAIIVKQDIMRKLYHDLEAGKTTAKIIRDEPSLGFKSEDIEGLRQVLLDEIYMNILRTNLEVVYLYGPTGCGKTSLIYANEGIKNVSRITHYPLSGTLFNDYKGQRVLVFEEFHSQVEISAMLNYLDIYPLKLPSRYHNKTACFTKVYLTSNMALEDQYGEVKLNRFSTWRAFLRRINQVLEMKQDGTIIEHKNEERILNDNVLRIMKGNNYEQSENQ